MKIKEKGATALLFMFLLTALLSGPALFAQGSKNENIRVPSEALKPAYTKEYFDNNLKDFKAWLESLAQLPAKGQEFKAKARDFGEISTGRVSLHLTNMRSVATNPDLEEVTKLPRSWYVQIYNSALRLQSAERTLVGMKVFCVEEDYQKARRIWVSAVAETLSIIAKPPKKLSAEELEVIAAENRERRKKEYIQQYKAKLAKEKAAGKKRSDKKKRASRETEEK